MDILNYFNLHTREFLYIESGLLILLFILILFYWMYYKKKFQAFKHQIPAGVVKTYLDSVIQNSNSLKSSLFRGSHDEVGIPTVFPLNNIPGGDSLDANTSGQLNQKNAEIASLQAAVADKKNLIKELENRIANMPKNTGSGIDPNLLADLQKQLAMANTEIERLKALLNQKKDAGPTGVPQDQFDKLKTEKEELEEKLKEYEVIEDDLANLKRLKQENDQLRKSLGQAGEASQNVSGGASDDLNTVVSGGSDLDDATTLVSGGEEEDSGPVTTEVAAAAPTPAATAPEAVAADKKTPEDLLSEFEKMLG